MSVVSPLVDLFFPPRCVACRVLLAGVDAPSPGMPFCEDCGVTLERVTSACERCGEALAESGCPRCLQVEPAFDRLSAVYRYGGAIADVLHRYKYEDHPEFARGLGDRLAALPIDPPDLVVAVPLHAARRRQRTYDQALYLADRLAMRRGWRLEPTLLTRLVATERQVGQDRAHRAGNVAGAFAAKRSVSGARIVLVDDVVTTGATVEECARVLKAAGAAHVHVVAVARA